MESSADSTLAIVRFEDRYAPDFERLNRLWLEGHGILEDADLPYLREPRRTILAPGGEIFVALRAELVVGVCGVVPRSESEYELVKLAVEPAARGRGLGRHLAERAVAFARDRGARRIVLSTSSKLTSANALYRKLGFVDRAPPESPDFATADVYLELALERLPLRVVAGGLDTAEVRALLAEHLADMRRISPPESVHALDMDALGQPGITFWNVRLGTELVGCGALKDLGERRGEVKSMRTAIAHRGRGVARATLEHILEEARRRDYTHLLLETGSQPEFLAARRLYETYGFVYRGPFDGYTDDPNSVFMERAMLADAAIEVKYECLACQAPIALRVSEREYRASLDRSRCSVCKRCGQRIGTGPVDCATCGHRFELTFVHWHVACNLARGNCPECGSEFRSECVC